jgi:hypothetical protein
MPDSLVPGDRDFKHETGEGMSEKIHQITELIRRESTGSPRPAASHPRRTESSAPSGRPRGQIG